MKHINIIGTCIFIILLTGMVQAIGIGTLEKKIVYTPGETASIKYYLVNEKSENLSYRVNFSGTLSPYVSFDLEQPKSWYSGFGTDLDNRLVRDIDLSNVSQATLNFYTKYKIEYGWDFGYVEISTNNGTSWTQIPSTGTTTFRDGSAYVGIPGAPAFTGESINWTYETANLTPYVGGKIKLRFRYLSDTYYAETGWFIDDIKIPEIEFFDDVTEGENNWTTDGWQITDRIESVTSETKTSPIIINLNIPANYTYNNTEENLIVTQLHWSGESFVASYESYPQIIVRLPPLEKYIPPPPSSGGGGGSNRPSTYTRTIGSRISYFASYMNPTRKESIKPGRRIDSPIMELKTLVKRTVYNVRVDINPIIGSPVDIIDRLEKVYKYFEIIAPKLDERNLEEATITFFVTSQWVEDNNATDTDIVVMRHHLGNWEELDTRFIGMEGPNHIFKATTPGFSTFAITKKQEPVAKQTVQTQPTEKPEAPDFEEILFVGNESEIENIKQKMLMKTKDAEIPANPKEPTESFNAAQADIESKDPQETEAQTVVQKTMKAIRGEQEDTMSYVEQEIQDMKPETAGKMLYKGLLTLTMIGLIMMILVLIIILIIVHEIRNTKEKRR